MKKILFVMAAFFGCITVSNAQSTLVATLSHGSDVTMFYGAYALRDALEKAESGDVINLSNGAFQAANITKGITLRGTGIDSTIPTYIVNDLEINIPSDDANRFTMEGIRCTGTMRIRGTFSDPCFLKCQFHVADVGNYEAHIENSMFANCKITESYEISHATAQFVNCYLGYCSGMYEESSATYLNCVMRQGGYLYNLGFSHLYNCILYNYDNWGYNYNIPSNSLAFNCVAINYDTPYAELVSHPNCTTSTLTEVFKDFTGEYSDEQTFELTDGAKTKFLGTDGTQVGLYGGTLSYTSTPSYPQFTKMKVDGKTSTDGKLGVDIEVGAGQ